MNHKKPIIPAGKGGSNYYLIFSIMEYEGIPILFIARDDFNTLYLCDCVEFRDFQRWTISMTNINILDMVINKRLSIFDALEKGEGLKIIATYHYDSGLVTHEKIAFDAIQPEDLPEKDAYACMVSHDACDNLRLLRLLMATPKNTVTPENNKNIHVTSTWTETQLDYVLKVKESAKLFSYNSNFALVA